MATWHTTKTNALNNVATGLKVVDGVLSFVKDGKGKPSKDERSLFAAAVVFTYGVWENYVEQLAIELVEHLAPKVEPEKVPEQVLTKLRKSDAWELTVSPGWRELWILHIKKLAIGDEDTYGLNTAKSGQVRNLLKNCGVNDAFASIDASISPDHLRPGISEADKAVDKLVELRGEIVHTGSVPDTLRKKHVKEWRDFIETLVLRLDQASRSDCKTLL